jgi:hypothetical protein
MKYGVALYKNDKYEGLVAHRAELTSFDDALTIAKRWDDAHAGLHDYRAVEMDACGMVCRNQSVRR